MNAGRPMMVVDARARQDGFKSHKNRGIGHYARRLLEGLRRSDHGFDPTFLVDTSLPLDPIHDGIPLIRYQPVMTSKALRFFEAQARLPGAILPAAPSLVHFLAHDDAAYRLRAPYLVTVHDMVSQEATELYGPVQQARHRVVGWFGRRNVERASFVIVDSDHTRKDAIRRFGINPDRVRVVHLAADDHLFAPVSREQLAAVQSKLSLPPRTLLYVGGIDPRKNLPRLLRALASFRGTDLDDVYLLMAGNIRSQAEFPQFETFIRNERLTERVRLLGYVDDATLAALYAGCDAFAFPTLYEGFGLPVLEAMAAGAPVITTKRSSIPELAGEAVMYVDPDDAGDIARGLREVLQRNELRESLRKAGPTRARLFSWERTVQSTVAIYRELFEEVSGGRVPKRAVR